MVGEFVAIVLRVEWERHTPRRSQCTGFR